MLSMLLTVTLVTTQADLVRYAATKGVKVATKTPAEIVSADQGRQFKGWVDGLAGQPFHRTHPRRNHHHSTNEPE